MTAHRYIDAAARFPHLYLVGAEYEQSVEPEPHGIVIRTLIRIIESDSGFFLLAGALSALDFVALVELCHG